MSTWEKVVYCRGRCTGFVLTMSYNQVGVEMYLQMVQETKQNHLEP